MENASITIAGGDLNVVAPKSYGLYFKDRGFEEAVREVFGRPLRLKFTPGDAAAPLADRPGRPDAAAKRTRPPGARWPIPRSSASAKCSAAKYAKSAISRSRHVKLPGNMQQMMRQAQQMQEKMQQEIAQIKVDATAGGGMVTVQMDGQKNLLTVKIDPEVAGDVEMLQDMVVAACGEAVKKVDAQIQQKMGGMLGGMGLPPGLF